MDLETVSEVEAEDLNASHMLATALKNMDGLIDSVVEHSLSPEGEDSATRLLRLATELRVAIEDHNLERRQQLTGENGATGDHPVDDSMSQSTIPSDCLQIIYEWLRERLPQHLDAEKNGAEGELIALRKELLAEQNNGHQAKRLQEELTGQSSELRRLQDLCDQLESQLEQKDNRISNLQESHQMLGSADSLDNGKRHHMHSDSMPVMPILSSSEPPPPVPLSVPWPPVRHDDRRKSLRMRLGSVIGRFRGQNQDSVTMMVDEALNGTSVLEASVQNNSRAQHFYGLEEEGLEAWLRGKGLERYSEAVLNNAPSGAELVKLLTSQNNMKQIMGISHALHQKKLQLAVKEAQLNQSDLPSQLNHQWVADWLLDIGLPQYREIFLDGLVDGSMLNELTYDDLAALQVYVPFHRTSLMRAIHGLRMASFHKDYLKILPEIKGAQQVLRWSAKKVSDWLKSVELGEYAIQLDGAGLHGALMVLEVGITDESLARLLGIPSSKTLLRQHLRLSFLDIVGPVCAQRKLDALHSKGFHPIDPIWMPKAPTRKKSRKRELSAIFSSGNVLLCPPHLGDPTNTTDACTTLPHTVD